MPITYANLSFNQRCIYQAFEQVTGNNDSGAVMGAYVNGKGLDADDSQAVDVLASKYGFKPMLGSTGAFFKNETTMEQTIAQKATYITL